MNPRLLATEADTFAAGRALGAAAGPGALICLHGDLGAGKTVFARGVGAGLGVQTRVQSPTFVLVQAHEGGRLPFWHADLYRLGHPEQVHELGLDELLADGGVLVVEWPERSGDTLPVGRLNVWLVEEGVGRALRWVATDAAHAALGAVLGG